MKEDTIRPETLQKRRVSWLINWRGEAENLKFVQRKETFGQAQTLKALRWFQC